MNRKERRRAETPPSPIARSGEPNRILVKITGAQGAGKSILARKIARLAQAEGLIVTLDDGGMVVPDHYEPDVTAKTIPARSVRIDVSHE
jgi:adenylylsulfate kinase-like enzyme